MPPPPTFPIRLTHARMLSPQVRELTFARDDGVAFEFQAGQWLSVVLPLAEGEARRAYSIASPPRADPTFQIAVTRVEGGPGSCYLHALEPGAVLSAIGPQGFFTRARSARHPALFVGTGTGVTPLRSMILDALAGGDPSPMCLLFGVRHLSDRLYVDEFRALERDHPQLRVLYSLSRPPEGWTELTGYVQSHVEAQFRALEAPGGEPPHVYICGLERMVGAVRDLLRKQMGIVRQQVHSERYD